MLSLFKDQEQLPLTRDLAISRARDLLASSLNKGIVPTWDQFFQELPVLSEAQYLDEIKSYYETLTEWPFLADIIRPEITEIFFHHPESSQVLYRDGRKEKIQLPLSLTDWQLWLEIVSIKFKQNWNVQLPFASFHASFHDKHYRWSLVHGSTSPTGTSKLMLRSLAPTPFPLSDFHAESLKVLVREKKNILIAGSTSSGKTSLLTALMETIAPEEHLVILEDTYEIISHHPHQTRFLSGPTPETSLRSYLAYSLRLSPDRIFLGEMRSSEAIPFLMAMNTGHKGLMGTIHASSAVDALHRTALLFSLYAGEANLGFEKVMELICRNLEYVVFMEKKKVKEVIRIFGSEKGVPFFEMV